VTRGRRPTALLAVLLLAGCQVMLPEAAGGGAAPATGTTVSTYASVADALLAEANRARARAGVPPLRADPALDRAAIEHAAELAVRRVLDHRSSTPGRETVTQRIEAAGGRWANAGENLASLTHPAEQVPSQTVGIWLGSTGHRRNLLDPVLTLAGTGIARHPTGHWYIVQIYVRPPPGD
jgi:uncharacterized protein YkwD